LATGSDQDLRYLAVLGLRRLGNRTALGLLVDRSLQDASREVRLAAAGAVGEMNFGIAPEEYYQQLRRRWSSKAIPAAEALTVIRDPYAVDTLLAMLKTFRYQPTVSRSTLGSRHATRVQGAGSVFGGLSISHGPARPSRRRAASRREPEARDRGLAEAVIDALRKTTGENPGNTAAAWLEWGRQRRDE
jgi:hypothetical protein